jgi:hypothetical protein
MDSVLSAHINLDNQESNTRPKSLVAGLDSYSSPSLRSPKSPKGTRILGENGMPQHSLKGISGTNNQVEGALTALYFHLVRNCSLIQINEYVDFFIRALHGLSDAKVAEYCSYLVMLCFQTRDCRGGKGERKIFSKLFLTLHTHFPKTMESLVSKIPEYGYWKDLSDLMVLLIDNDSKSELRVAIINTFVEQLRHDLENLDSWEADKNIVGETFDKNVELSLAGKWAPREGGSFDKKIRVSKELASRLFPEEYTKRFSLGMSKYRVALSRLNKAINTTELLMCDKRFSEIKFKLVPGRCLSKYRRAFLNQTLGGGESLRHPEDADRMECRNNLIKFIEEVRSGKRKINANQLFIHEIVDKINGEVLESEEHELLELCWNSILDTYKQQIATGEISLGKGVVLADVSGSMSGTPMSVSIACAIFISELLSGPYKNRFMTFDTNPTWFNIPEDAKLVVKINAVAGSPWGGSTNFEKAMNLILDVAIINKLQPEDMPTWLLVLSDMQFDQANGRNNWETMHEHIVDRFTQVGLRTVGKPYKVPKMIYWNLRSDTSGFPVTSSKEGCVMVSGFSVSILKEIFKNQDLSNISPWINLKSILDNKRYEPIKQITESVSETPYFRHYGISSDVDVVNDVGSPTKVRRNVDLSDNTSFLNYIASYFSRN